MFTTDDITECNNCGQYYATLQTHCPLCNTPANAPQHTQAPTTNAPTPEIAPFTFTVLGNPIPKQSAQFGNGKAWTRPAAKQWQNTIIQTLALMPDVPHFGDKLLCVHLWFYRETKQRTDVDNLAKGTLDAIEKLLFDNDSQIVELHIYKRIDRANPRAIIKVQELKGMKED